VRNDAIDPGAREALSIQFLVFVSPDIDRDAFGGAAKSGCVSCIAGFLVARCRLAAQTGHSSSQINLQVQLLMTVCPRQSRGAEDIKNGLFHRTRYLHW
jgi:hypothetical protein